MTTRDEEAALLRRFREVQEQVEAASRDLAERERAFRIRHGLPLTETEDAR